MQKVTTLIVSVEFVSFFAIAAFAHSGATGIVKERMDGMVAIAKSMKELVGMSKAGSVDGPKAASLAKVIQSHSGNAMLERFPNGPVPMVSEASPAIWDNWTVFEALADRLDTLAEGLALSAMGADQKTGLTFGPADPLPPMDVLAATGFDDLLKATTQTCSSCHEAFRIKK